MKFLALILLLTPLLAVAQVTEQNLIDAPMGFKISHSKVGGKPAFKKGEPSITITFLINKKKAEGTTFTKDDSLNCVKEGNDLYTFLDSYILFFNKNKTVGIGQGDNFFPERGTWTFDEKKQEVVWVDDDGETTIYTVTKPAGRMVLTIHSGPENVTEFIEY